MLTIKIKPKIFFLIALTFLPYFSFSQFISVDFGVNGLTCSACTRSVEMSIRKLNFVEDVVMDLKNTNGKITFNTEIPVSIDKIAKAITDAGFSVRYLNAVFKFDPITISDNYCFVYENSNYQFINVGKKKIEGNTVIKFIGKEFLPKREYKNFIIFLQPLCETGKQKTYYVKL